MFSYFNLLGFFFGFCYYLFVLAFNVWGPPKRYWNGKSCVVWKQDFHTGISKGMSGKGFWDVSNTITHGKYFPDPSMEFLLCFHTRHIIFRYLYWRSYRHPLLIHYNMLVLALRYLPILLTSSSHFWMQYKYCPLGASVVFLLKE